MIINKQEFELARAKKCMTLDELKKIAKCSHNTIQKGLQEDIDPSVVGRIAKALEVDVKEIIVHKD